MNCHSNHNENNNQEGNNNGHKHSPMKHMLHMIICCGLPILILFSLPFIATLSPGIAVVLGVIAPFICPVMMGGMMFMMFRGSKKKTSNDNAIDAIDEKKRIEL